MAYKMTASNIIMMARKRARDDTPVLQGQENNPPKMRRRDGSWKPRPRSPEKDWDEQTQSTTDESIPEANTRGKELYVSYVPIEHTREDILEWHENCGLDNSTLVSIKLLEPHENWQLTRSCIFRYTDDVHAQVALEVLDRQEVTLSSGAKKWLGVKPAAPAHWTKEQGSVKTPNGSNSGKQIGSSPTKPPTPPAPPRREHRGVQWPSLVKEQNMYGSDVDERKGKDLANYNSEGHYQERACNRSKNGHAKIQTAKTPLVSVYVSDVPVDDSEELIRDWHAELGLDNSTLVAIKMLEPHTQHKLTRSCIFRYSELAHAKRAAELLSGQEVTVSSGVKKYLGAKVAPPFQWMKDQGFMTLVKAANGRRPPKSNGNLKKLRQEEQTKEHWQWSNGSIKAEIDQYIDNIDNIDDIDNVDNAGPDIDKGPAPPPTFHHRPKPPPPPPPPPRTEELYPGPPLSPPSPGPEENDQELPAVHLSGLPTEYDAEDIRTLHTAVGLDEQSVVTVQLLPHPQKAGVTRACILQYETLSEAEAAIKQLDGEELTTASCTATHLGARFHKVLGPAEAAKSSDHMEITWQPKPKSRAKTPWSSKDPVAQPNQSHNSNGHKPKGRAKTLFLDSVAQPSQSHNSNGHKKVQKLFPSIYLSDVPVEYSDGEIRGLHAEVGLDPEKLVAVKYFEPQHKKTSRSCVLRYHDDDVAQLAIEKLKGYEVIFEDGTYGYLGASPAAPARWMVQEGLAESPGSHWKHRDNGHLQSRGDDYHVEQQNEDTSTTDLDRIVDSMSVPSKIEKGAWASW